MGEAARELSERERRTARTRDQILDAAIDVFAEHGFEGSTLSNIAERSGSKIPLIVYHFDNKEALWRAAVNAVWQRTQDTMREIATRTNPDLDGSIEEAVQSTDRFRAAVLALAKGVAEHPEYLRMLLREASHPGPRFDWLAEHHLTRDFEEALRLITGAQKRALLPDLPAEHLVYMLTGMLYFPLFIEADVERQTGTNPRSSAHLASYVESVLTLLAPTLTNSTPPPNAKEGN